MEKEQQANPALPKTDDPEVHADNVAMHRASSRDRLRRSRSVHVGKAYVNSVEVMLRTDTDYMWGLLNYNEALSLIHQIAAAIDCQVVAVPRVDFASFNRNSEQHIELINKQYDVVQTLQAQAVALAISKSTTGDEPVQITS